MDRWSEENEEEETTRSGAKKDRKRYLMHDSATVKAIVKVFQRERRMCDGSVRVGSVVPRPHLPVK